MATLPFSDAAPAPAAAADYADGFHAPENEKGLPFRWMARRARFDLAPAAGAGFIELWVRCHVSDLSQRLTLAADGAEPAAFDLVYGWNVVSLALPARATALRLDSNQVLPLEAHPGDGRELALQVRPPARHADAGRHARTLERQARAVSNLRQLHASPLGAFLVTAREVRFEAGFHGHEVDDGLPFRWMARRARLTFPARAEARFLELWVRSALPDLSQRLKVTAGDAPPCDHVLAPGWNTLSVELPAGCEALDLEAGRLVPRAMHPHDLRELAVQVRVPLIHSEAARHAHVGHAHANHVLNFEELMAGALELASRPVKLGIDLTGTCNIKPPCVYCAWDLSKEREGGNVELPFNLDTLAEYGDFFEGASELVNCSIGEPFMMKDIDPLLDAFGQRGKLLELTTNGQILTDTNIRKLLGRNAHLYISLDAATAETYARLRNGRWEQVLANVRRLVEAKGGPGNLPLVYLVFMPMRANVHEADDFVALCADLRADRLVLRPLNASPGTDLVWDRASYRYDYQQELLPFEELVRVSGRVAELSRRLGVELSDQMDFGGEMGPSFAALYEAGRREAAARFEAGVSSAAPVEAPVAPRAESPLLAAPPPVAPPQASGEAADEAPLVKPKLPICTEPWTSLYVLRRGTLPCCYGGAAVAPMQEFKQAWNSPLLQDIRRELRAGRFHRYCFDSPDCPLVRKSEEHHDLSATQAALLRGTRLWTAWKRAGFGLPGSVYRQAKHLARNAAGRLRRT